MNMGNHDSLPKSLRLFLHEWASHFPPRSIVQIVDTLKAGYGINITAPDGKVHRIETDPPQRR